MNGLDYLAAMGRAPVYPAAGGVGQQASSSFHLKTPQEVIDQIRALDAEFACLDVSVQSAQGVPPPFREGWGRQLAAWRAFVKDNAEGFAAAAKMGLTGTGTVSRRADEWRRTLVAWDAQFRAQNPPAAAACPAPVPPMPPPAAGAQQGWRWPWWGTSLLTLGAVAGAGYLTYATYRYYTQGQRDIARARELIERRVGLRGAEAPGDVDGDPAVARDRNRPLSREERAAILPYLV